jgi:hypothetical protein
MKENNMKYATYKTIHNWLGLFLLAPIILTSMTGVLWMHEKSLGLKPSSVSKGNGTYSDPIQSVSQSRGQLTIASALSPENLEAITCAMAEAKNLWGSNDIEIEKFEIKNDPEFGMIVKVVSYQKTKETPYEFSLSIASKEIVSRKGGPRLANGQGGTDWAKIVHDLHTGKFFSNDFGFLWSDLGAGAIVLLGVTGVVLYVLPILKKSANQKRRAKSSTQPPGRPSQRGSVAPALAVVDESVGKEQELSVDLVRS